MPRKKKAEEMVQASLGHRISKHEAICAERMKTLFRLILEASLMVLTKEWQSLITELLNGSEK